MRASIASCVACPLPSIPALRSFRAASVCRYLRLHRAAKASPSPAAMHFFQIEFADGLSGDCEVIAGGKIVPELEGLSGGSHPADFLRIMSDGARPLHVIYSRPSNIPGRNRIRPRGTGRGRIPETMRPVCAARQHLRPSETGRPGSLRHEIRGDSSCVSRGHDVRRRASAEVAGPLLNPSKENRLDAAFHTRAHAIRSTIRNSALWRVKQMLYWEKLG